ncbi:SDR family NAD(P)-dependent oxidoreductase [Kiloniella sp.]|uniref:SDR family NAD(P)-dependent oxidoreductase n=1 Tax=Kiloniella sp. TaxID=1938587 RepID=UPI003B027AEC
MSELKPLAIIAGAGPGLGMTMATKLANENHHVLAISRSKPDQDPVNENIHFNQVDLGDRASVEEIINHSVKKFGPPKVLIHNTAQLVIKPFLDTNIEEFSVTWNSMVQTAINVCQLTIPHMLAQGEGTVIMTGATASLRGGKNFSAFSSAKFALRGLAQSLAREFQPQGIHVAHVILDGIIDTERSRERHALDPLRMMKPEDIAQAYWQLIQQPKSTWSHELDLRPYQENF